MSEPQNASQQGAGGVVRRYRLDDEYTKDAANMAASGWQVSDLQRAPDNTIIATYTYGSATPSEPAAGSQTVRVSGHSGAPTPSTPIMPGADGVAPSSSSSRSFVSRSFVEAPPDAPTISSLTPPGGLARSRFVNGSSGIRSRLQGGRAWFARQSPRMRAGLGAGAGALALLLVCACCTVALASGGGASSDSPQSASKGSNGTGMTAHQATGSAAAAKTRATGTVTALPLTPTATMTATPPPTATRSPTKTPVPYHLSIKVTCASAVDYSYGQVCVHTHAGATLTIVVTYCSGYQATSASLQGTRTANSQGNYTWSWVPETKCRGTADAFITADWGGQEATADPSFTVR